MCAPHLASAIALMIVACMVPAAFASLVVHYPMVEGSGDTLSDAIAGRDAKVASGKWVASSGRSALAFDGAATVATLEDASELPIREAMTVDLWMRPQTVRDPVALAVLPPTFRLLLYPGTGKILVEVRGEQGRIYEQIEAGATRSAWHHIALTYARANGARLFVDGASVWQDETDVGMLVAPASPLRIGLGVSAQQNRYYRGLLGGLRIWDEQLAGDKIAAIVSEERPALARTFRGEDDLMPNLPPADPIDVGGLKQLFIDNTFIETSRGVGLRMNPPEKLGPVIVPEMPWEMNMGFCASVIEHEGIFKLFYRCESFEQGANVCLATSDDGINWDRPVLGVCDYEGSKDNNIVFKGVGEAVVFLDPHGKAEERFKMIVMQDWPDPEKGGLYCHTSPDGIHWQPGPHVLDIGPDTANQAAWDAQRGKYVAYVRKWDPLRKVGRIETDDVMKPWPYEKLGDNAYFIWGRDKIAVPSREMPTAFGYDDQDPVESDHYNAAAVEYPWAQNAYFMFPSAYMHHPSPPPNDGLLDIQLAASRDGVEFSRLERSPYVPLGREGSIDSQCLYMAVGILRKGDDLFQYYGGYDVSHGGHNEKRTRQERQGSICAVKQRLDGFISADANYNGGEIITPPMVFAGDHLGLNIDCSAMGRCDVGILDADGEAVPGFETDNCDPIHGNHISKTVTWAGNGDLSSLAGKPVRLHFVMRAAKLYAFGFGHGDD